MAARFESRINPNSHETMESESLVLENCLLLQGSQDKVVN